MLKPVPFLRIAIRLVLAVCVSGVLPLSLPGVRTLATAAAHAGIAADRQFHTADAAGVSPRIVARAAARRFVTRKGAGHVAALPAGVPAAVHDIGPARQTASTSVVRPATRLPNPLRGPPSLI